MKLKYVGQITGLLLTAVLIVGCACQGIKDPVIRHANSTFLPRTVAAEGRNVEVDNFYRRMPGCYLTCNTRGGHGAAELQGLLRVNGLYVGRNCQAQGYFFKDLSKISYFSKLCQKNISACKGKSCYAGNDTGGFLGIP